MRPRFTWNLGRRSLHLGERTLVMGIVNVTPDSFSDGGQFSTAQQAINHAVRLLDEGADILDIGGESTRPGAHVNELSANDETHRILPVIEGVKSSRPEAIVSIDTYKSATARAAVNAGAEIINEVSGLRWDEAMAHTIADLGCGCVLMHMRGTPDTWRTLPQLPNPTELVTSELRETADHALQAGIARERIVLDPGFGFGKTLGHNLALLASLERIVALGYPVLVGLSRKGSIGALTGRSLDARVHGSVAAALAAVARGASIVRVHDVGATIDALAVWNAVAAARHEALHKPG